MAERRAKAFLDLLCREVSRLERNDHGSMYITGILCAAGGGGQGGSRGCRVQKSNEPFRSYVKKLSSRASIPPPPQSHMFEKTLRRPNVYDSGRRRDQRVIMVHANV